MIHIDFSLSPAALLPAIRAMWEASAIKIDSLEKSWKPGDGAPVFTIEGRYTARGWTEWTQGFQFGSPLLQFDATGERRYLEIGRRHTQERMASHVSHVGVHDHGFNNVSTYGALWRLMREGKVERNDAELGWYELALQTSGAVQAARWSRTADGTGYIYSFNGPHSLFCDTIRSLRSLSLAHRLGHRLMGENDAPISLLGRMIEHARNTAKYNVFYGEGRDAYDIRGRVAHESIFNTNDGHFRCPSTQQGYSPFSTWTRGLAWIMLGCAEQLEFLATIEDAELVPWGGRAAVEAIFTAAARASCDFYIDQTPTDGVPYWDTGAPGLARMGDYLGRPSEPFNDHEPVDSSAAAIACQGLIRLGNCLKDTDPNSAARYTAAGLTTLQTLLSEPYLSHEVNHQGLLLHAVYHRPRNWDFIPEGRKIPCGESCQWGDYHLREAALTVQRLAEGGRPYVFFGPSA